MENLYNKNGLVFWTEQEIRVREMLVSYFCKNLFDELRNINKAFDIFQIEAPLLTPSGLINPQYTSEDVFQLEDLTLRPETTMGSYSYAQYLLSTHKKVQLPICVWQHGKSFRNEQDQVVKNMRLKEFYQLEFQIIYSFGTKADYSANIIVFVKEMMSKILGPCRVEESDRIPDYAKFTMDIIFESLNMEICSISQRKDYDGAHVLEVAIGTDRCVHCWETK